MNAPFWNERADLNRTRRMAEKVVVVDHNVPPGGRRYRLVNWGGGAFTRVRAESLNQARETQVVLWGQQLARIAKARAAGLSPFNSLGLPRTEAEVDEHLRADSLRKEAAVQRKQRAFRASAQALWRDADPSLDFKDVEAALTLAIMSRTRTL